MTKALKESLTNGHSLISCGYREEMETREARYKGLFGFVKDENGKELWKKEMQKNDALLQIYKGSHILASSGKAS